MERSFNVKMQSEPKPFWDRHFTPITALLTGVLVALVGISGLKLFVNDAPAVTLRMGPMPVTLGESVVVRAWANDSETSDDDLQYSWRIVEREDLSPQTGVGRAMESFKPPTDKVGTWTVEVTVTDSGAGLQRRKRARNEAIYVVVPKALTPGAVQGATASQDTRGSTLTLS